ncbi:MAG: hypothetical protein KTR31_09125 [Myxococcales bacterium]|nr:hypothetical protein [Myxococcales bacterium]
MASASLDIDLFLVDARSSPTPRRLGAAQVAAVVSGVVLATGVAVFGALPTTSARIGAYLVVLGLVLLLEASRRRARHREWQRFSDSFLRRKEAVVQSLRRVRDGRMAYAWGRAVGRALVRHRHLPDVPAPWRRRTRAEGVVVWLSIQLPHVPREFLQGLEGTVRRHADQVCDDDG